ncbi:hypothetical protein N1851_026107 [Merluccius polli]|uniref:Uncharacterized protein n=1 Tax=Merluccius polli TaxID=89951 RepID=A0AA47NT94_MERPO|nr:hypothetical protein N1851_026107 [Merluccius polli]
MLNRPENPPTRATTANGAGHTAKTGHRHSPTARLSPTADRRPGSHQRVFCMRDTGSHQRVFAIWSSLLDLMKAMLQKEAARLLLRCFATGTYLHTVGDAENISKNTVCLAIREVVAAALNTLLNMFVVFPNFLPTQTVKEGFYQLAEAPDWPRPRAEAQELLPEIAADAKPPQSSTKELELQIRLQELTLREKELDNEHEKLRFSSTRRAE